jgi:hypothetical protein
MAKLPTPETIAAALMVPERVLLFCVASNTDWAKAGVTGATAQHLHVRGLIERAEGHPGALCPDGARPQGVGRIAERRDRDMIGARYAICIDGQVRTNRDVLEVAIEAADLLKSGNPYDGVADHVGGALLAFGTSTHRVAHPPVLQSIARVPVALAHCRLAENRPIQCATTGLQTERWVGG